MIRTLDYGKSITGMHPSTIYIRKIKEHAEIIAYFLRDELRDTEKEDVQLICKGSSGIMLATLVADILDQYDIHTSIQYFKNDASAVTGNRNYCVLKDTDHNNAKSKTITANVDDFFDTGETVENILEWIAHDVTIHNKKMTRYGIERYCIDEYHVDYLIVNNQKEDVDQTFLDVIANDTVKINEIILTT